MQTSVLDPRFSLPKTICFVIGAQKAGTTWVQNHFMIHEQVCVPRLKELNYWNSVRYPFKADTRLAKKRPGLVSLLRRFAGTPGMRQKERARQMIASMGRGSENGVHDGYADVLFDGYAGERVLAEVTPQYALLRTDTFREMASLGQDVRFVFILRDPLGRIHSRLNHRLGNASTTVTSQAARKLYEEMLSAGGESDLIKRSAYEVTLAALEDAVPAERIALFFYEDFFKPEQQARLSHFLGIEHVDGKVEKRVLKSKAVVRDFPADLDARALELLRPTYAHFVERFGDGLPSAWRRSIDSIGLATNGTEKPVG